MPGVEDGRVIKVWLRNSERGSAGDCIRVGLRSDRDHDAVISGVTATKCPKEVGVFGRGWVCGDKLPICRHHFELDRVIGLEAKGRAER